MENKTDIQPARIEENYKSLIIAGISKTYWHGSPMNIPAQWEQFGQYLGNIPNQKGNVAYGLCFDLEGNKGIEYLCGVEVLDVNNLPKEFTTKQLPLQTYAVFEHNDHVSTLRNTIDIISKHWIPDPGYEIAREVGYFFEYYGEKFDPQKGIGNIEVWIPTKEK